MPTVNLSTLLSSTNFIGYTGSRGTAGDTGPTGPAGSTGYTGSQGIGYAGSIGDLGYTGSIGYTGSRGLIGYSGSAGSDASVVGYSGSAGGAAIAGNLYISGTTTVNNSILPTSSNVFNIGSNELRFGALYLAGNTITLGNSTITSTADGSLIFSTTSGNVSLNANTVNFLSTVANTTTAGGNLTVEGSVISANVYAGAYFYSNGAPFVSAGSGGGGNGYTGSIGYTGSVGYTGSIGSVGYTGSSGSTGSIGFTGSQGNLSSVRTGTNGATTSGNISINIDSFDQYNLFGLTDSVNILIPTGTPIDGQRLLIRILDDGLGARNISWTTTGVGSFREVGVSLPSVTTLNKIMYVGGVYNSQFSCWDVIAVTIQA